LADRWLTGRRRSRGVPLPAHGLPRGSSLYARRGLYHQPVNGNARGRVRCPTSD